MDINTRITKLIQAENLTANAFASKLGVKATIIYNIQKGRNKPGFDLMTKILSTFNVDANWLLFGTVIDGTQVTTNDEVYYNKSVNLNLDNDVNLNQNTAEKWDNLLDDMSPEEMNKGLVKLAKSTLLYLEFHLIDIDLNLKLLKEKNTAETFDRKEYDVSTKTLNATCKLLTTIINSGLSSNSALIGLLLSNDDLIRSLLDNIRQTSKDLYLHS